MRHKGKRHTLALSLARGENGESIAQLSICSDAEEMCRRYIEYGYSVYQGIVEHDDQMYDYILPFAGSQSLDGLLEIMANFVRGYIDEIMGTAKDDLLLCRTDLSKGKICTEFTEEHGEDYIQ